MPLKGIIPSFLFAVLSVLSPYPAAAVVDPAPCEAAAAPTAGVPVPPLLAVAPPPGEAWI